MKFVIIDEYSRQSQKKIALPHAELVTLSRKMAAAMVDPWCARLAALHLQKLISTGEDMEKDLVSVLFSDLKRYAAEIAQMEQGEATAR